MVAGKSRAVLDGCAMAASWSAAAEESGDAGAEGSSTAWLGPGVVEEFKRLHPIRGEGSVCQRGIVPEGQRGPICDHGVGQGVDPDGAEGWFPVDWDGLRPSSMSAGQQCARREI